MGLVSIIVPAYNVKSYIERCVDSLLDQTYSELEIILVDDGSTDGTGELCDCMAEKDKRIHVIHQNNQGISAARNAGLDLAGGEYIFFVDSDDWIRKNTIETLMRLREEYQADVVCCGIELIYDSGKAEVFTEVGKRVCNSKEAVLELMTGATICSVAWNKLYVAKLWKEIRFCIGKVHEDEFTIYKVIYQAEKTVYTDEVMYEYFQRVSGTMDQIYRNGNLTVIDALRERTDWLTDKGEDHLAAVSLLKTVERIKYLYRKYRAQGKVHSGECLRIRGMYAEDAKKVYANRDVSWKDKAKTLFWEVALPMERMRK